MEAVENKACNKCDLCKTSYAGGIVNICIPGVGPQNAGIMLIGEAPGYEEVRSNTPFVGDAGKQLDRCLIEAGMDRKEIFISNTVRCRPLNNIAPTAIQIKACAEYLDAEIGGVKPKVLCLLGNTAISRILNGVGTVTHIRGNTIWSEKYSCWCVPMFHPSYLIRNITQTALKDLLVKDLKLANEVAKEVTETGSYKVKKAPVQYRTCKTVADAKELFAELSKQEAFSFDLETDGLDFLKVKILSIAFSWKAATGTILPFIREHKSLWTQEEEDCAWLQLRELFSSSKVKIAHNLDFDALCLKSKNVEVVLPTFDTMLAHHLLDENARGQHGLKDCAWRYTDMGGYEKGIDKYFDSEGLANAPFDELCKYACCDVDCTYRLFELFKEQLKGEGLTQLYETIVMKLQQVLIESEFRGVRIDKELLEYLSRKYQGMISDLEERLRSYPEIKVVENTLPVPKKGESPKFNFASPLQLRKLFFEVLRLPSVQTTDKGSASTNEEVLRILAGKHEIPKLLLEHRKYSKLYNTYVKGTQKLLTKDSRIHTAYSISGTVTGRIASSNPNLMNVPEEVRGICIADPGCMLIGMDYKQAEFRMWANYSQDPVMIKAIKEGKDIHSMIASFVLKVPEASVTKEQRSLAKGVVFGLMYGRGIDSLVQELKCSYQVAQQIIDTFFGRYPKAAQWLKDTKRIARQTGRVRNHFGRLRRLPQITSNKIAESAEAERQAVNSPIQGGAADVTAVAMIRIQDRLKEIGSKAYQVLTVHDSIVWNCPSSEVEEVVKIVYEEATKEIPGIVVPFDADLKIGKNWGEV